MIRSRFRQKRTEENNLSRHVAQPPEVVPGCRQRVRSIGGFLEVVHRVLTWHEDIFVTNPVFLYGNGREIGKQEVG